MQTLTSFARIGRAPVIRALGIQKNYSEITYEEKLELDREASGCFCCSNFHNIEYAAFLPEASREKCRTICASCPRACFHRIYVPHRKYVNEKNRYGYAQRVKGIALKLFLVYHFSSPDANGFIRGLHRQDLAELLSCSVRSIDHANATLQRCGYIMLSGCGRGFNVFLKEYKTYGLPAEKGGRGYATFSLALLKELISLKDANQLRIIIRSALDLDRMKPGDVLSRKFPELRRYLPGYCKDGIIKKALSSLPAVFHVRISGTTAEISMDHELQGRRLFDEQNAEHSKQMQDFISSLDGLIEQTNLDPTGNASTLRLLDSMGISRRVKTAGGNDILLKYDLTPSDYKDLGILCTTYSLKQVKEAVTSIYNTYIPGRSLKSIGALIRTLLRRQPPSAVPV